MSFARELELCHLGRYECIGAAGAIREGAQNPIATTLNAEHFVMTEKLTMRHPVVSDEDLPLFYYKKLAKLEIVPYARLFDAGGDRGRIVVALYLFPRRTFMLLLYRNSYESTLI